MNDIYLEELIEKKIHFYRQMGRVIEELHDNLPAGVRIWISDLFSTMVVGIEESQTDWGKLTEVREYLRKCCPDWADRLTQTFHTGGTQMVATYRGLNHPIEIRLPFDVNNPPPNFLKKGCRIERSVGETPEVSYSVVCDVEGGK